MFTGLERCQATGLRSKIFRRLEDTSFMAFGLEDWGRLQFGFVAVLGGCAWVALVPTPLSETASMTNAAFGPTKSSKGPTPATGATSV